MANEQKLGSDQVQPAVGEPGTGSPNTLPNVDPLTGGGKSTADNPVLTENTIPKEQYEELEKKLGQQGVELGDLRGFLREISPLLDKLQDNPNLAEQIVEGKITPELVKAIAEDKITIQDAVQVTKAHEDVKKDLGLKKYSATSPEAIEKLIADKVEEVKRDLQKTETKIEKKLSTSDDRRRFEKTVDTFIAETADFADYADDITKWFNDHPDQFDIQIAYHAVKGKKSSEQAAKQRDIDATEAAKNVAANQTGGLSQGTQVPGGDDLIDRLIGGSPNPNVL